MTFTPMRPGGLEGLRRFNPYATSAAWSGHADTGRHAFVDQLAQTGGAFAPVEALTGIVEAYDSAHVAKKTGFNYHKTQNPFSRKPNRACTTYSASTPYVEIDARRLYFWRPASLRGRVHGC